MNERMTQMAERCGLYGIKDYDNNISEDVSQSRLDKFAELIVRDCINEIAYIGKAGVDNVINNHSDRTDRGDLNQILWTTETAIEKIKQHFGVEE